MKVHDFFWNHNYLNLFVPDYFTLYLINSSLAGLLIKKVAKCRQALFTDGYFHLFRENMYLDTHRDLARLSTLFSVAMVENSSSHSSMLAKCFNGRKISPLMGLLLIVTFMCPTAELTWVSTFKGNLWLFLVLNLNRTSEQSLNTYMN